MGQAPIQPGLVQNWGRIPGAGYLPASFHRPKGWLVPSGLSVCLWRNEDSLEKCGVSLRSEDGVQILGLPLQGQLSLCRTL